MHTPGDTLTTTDAIGLLQAVAFAALFPDARQRLTVALSEFARQVDADMVTAVQSFIDPATGQTHFEEMLVCGQLEDHRKQGVISYLATAHADDPFYAAFGVAAAKAASDDPGLQIFIARRQELVADDAWYSSEHYRTTRTRIGVDAAIYAGIRTRLRGVWVGSGLHRHQGRPQFTARDQFLARSFFLGCRPLFDAFADSPKGAGPFLAGLSVRQRELVFALLAGLASREIGARLGLTEQSVQTYCKRLYKRLGISGRGELVRLCHAKGVVLDAPVSAIEP